MDNCATCDRLVIGLVEKIKFENKKIFKELYKIFNKQDIWS